MQTEVDDRLNKTSRIVSSFKLVDTIKKSLSTATILNSISVPLFFFGLNDKILNIVYTDIIASRQLIILFSLYTY